jgi:hypothetical protein
MLLSRIFTIQHDPRRYYMVRQLIPHKLLTLALLLAVMPSSNVIAQEPGFRVNSFIPEKFTDLLLRVNGGFELYGSNTERGERDLSAGLYSLEDRKYDHDSRLLNVGGSFLYRYETVPRFLTFSSDLSASYRSYDQNEVSDRYYPDGRYNFYDWDDDVDEYTLRLQQYFDGAAYLVQDMFVSCRAEIASDFHENSGDNIDVSGDADPPDFMGYIYEISYDAEGTSSGHTKHYQLNLEFLPGWGRIYEGNYASTAIYMVNELKNQGFLEKVPTNSEMTELTEIIYRYRLKHAIDKRLHRIEALTAIVDFLKDKDLVRDLHPGGSAIVQDVWDYFPHTYRPFGYRFRLGFGIEYSYRSGSSTDESSQHRIATEYHVSTPDVIDTTLDTTYQYYSYNRNRSETTSPYLACLFEYANPIDHRWQLNIEAQGRLYFNHDLETNIRDTMYSYYYYYNRLIDRTTDLKEYYTFAIEGNATCILDSRTSAIFAASYDLNHVKREISEHRIQGLTDVDTSSAFDAFSSWEFRIYAGLDYRMSIPTTLTAYIEYRRSSEQIEYTDTLDDLDRGTYRFYANISHYIF